MRRSILTVLVALAVLFFFPCPRTRRRAVAVAGTAGAGAAMAGMAGHGARPRYGTATTAAAIAIAIRASWSASARRPSGGERPTTGTAMAWYGYPGYGYAPPRVVVTERPVYVQRSAPAPAAYWYYCESEGGYYPDVPTCPEEWVPVPPRPDSDY